MLLSEGKKLNVELQSCGVAVVEYDIVPKHHCVSGCDAPQSEKLITKIICIARDKFSRTIRFFSGRND